MSDVTRFLSEQEESHLEELKELLRIPSISALPAHKPDIGRAARWLAGFMDRIGLKEVRVMPTAGLPVVFGQWLEAPGAPTVLIYGHYDVQPVDPEHLWQTPPFDPAERDGKLYARGASDDKGQTFMHLKVIEAFLRTAGRLPVNVKVLIEGEEEIGSPSLGQFIADNRELLAADLVVVSDTSLWAPRVPAICYGLRGLAGLQIDVRGAAGDLHSGLYGGAAPNAVHALVQILASLRDAGGRIRVEGFYDGVRPVTVRERQAMEALGFDEADLMQQLAVDALPGEPGYSALERIWARPTLEVNGIWGGFQGEGSKTVIPAEAHAKITCRLVPDQDPQAIIAAIEAHVARHCPPGVRAQVVGHHTARPWLVEPNHAAVKVAAGALEQEYGRPPVFTRMGGSIPVVDTFATLLQLPVVLLGFGLPDENFHAPNEHFHLENFRAGMRVLCRYWRALAGVTAP